jgi:hypothetical protein
MKRTVLLIVIIFGSIFTVNVIAEEKKPSAKVMVDLSPNKPVQKLFPLTLLSINGDSVIHRNDMIMLEPAKYHLKFYANIDLNYFIEGDRILKSKINQRKYQDSLDLEVEAGHVYQLGFDASSVKTEEWRPVLLSATASKK